MAPIFTTQFYVGTLAPGITTTIYSVQPGFVAVLRDVDFGCATAGDVLLIVAAGQNVVFLVSEPAGAYAHAQWQGRIALGAGNSFALRNLSSENMYVAATGYVLKS